MEIKIGVFLKKKGTVLESQNDIDYYCIYGKEVKFEDIIDVLLEKSSIKEVSEVDEKCKELADYTFTVLIVNDTDDDNSSFNLQLKLVKKVKEEVSNPEAKIIKVLKNEYPKNKNERYYFEIEGEEEKSTCENILEQLISIFGIELANNIEQNQEAGAEQIDGYIADKDVGVDTGLDAK